MILSSLKATHYILDQPVYHNSLNRQGKSYYSQHAANLLEVFQMGYKIFAIYFACLSFLVAKVDSFYPYRIPTINYYELKGQDDFVKTLEILLSIKNKMITCSEYAIGSPVWLDRKCWKELMQDVEFRNFVLRKFC